MDEVLKVEGLSRAYRDTLAVRSLSFTLGPGRILGLVGPNGAGKTTSMRTIAGILSMDAGSVAIGGHDLARSPLEAKRLAAYVPDDPALFEALTVWEHLEFIASAYEIPDLQSRGTALLKTFELTDRRDSITQELSRGMRQKLALCLAWLHRPALVMLDEPMTGLDPHAIRALKHLIRDAAGRGVSFVISSHQLGLVEDLCTDLLLLMKGERRFLGTMEEARALNPGVKGIASLEALFFVATGDPPTERV